MLPHVTCIILNYNNWALTQQCLQSLAASFHTNLTVLVIDNQSPQQIDTLQYKDTTYHLYDTAANQGIFDRSHNEKKPLYTIQNHINGGFSSGVNIGIHFANQWLTTDYFWLLNNDVIVTPNTLSELVAIAHPSRIVGSTLTLPNQQPARSLGRIHPLLGTSSSTTSIANADYIPFTSVLIPRQTIQTIGVLDERFFLYYEDADFCKRALAHHITLHIAQKSQVIHMESQTVTDKQNRTACPDWLPIYSKKLFMIKHGYPMHWIWASLGISCLKRFLRLNIRPAIHILELLINEKKRLKTHHYYKNNFLNK